MSSRSTRSSLAASAAATPTPENGGQSTRSSRKTQATRAAAAEPNASLPKQRGRGRPPKVTVTPELLPESPELKSAAPAVSKAPGAKKTGKQASKTPAGPSPQLPLPQMSPKKIANLQKERQSELADEIWSTIKAKDAREMAKRSSRTVRHLANIQEADESAGEEVFNVTDVSGGSSEDEAPKAPPVAAPPARIPASADAASEIAALKAKIEELEALSRMKEKKPASAQKGTRKPPSSFASGLHPLYFQQANKDVTGTDTQRSISPFEMGGLDDDDIADTCPTSSIATGANAPAKIQQESLARQYSTAKGLTRDTARKNDNVLVALHDQPAQRQAQNAAVPPRLGCGQPLRHHETFIDLTAPASTHATASTHAPASTNTNPPSKTKPNSRKSKKALKQDSSENSERNSAGRLTANGVRTADLPNFLEARNKWKAVFLPSLYHTLFLSLETFDAFRSSSPEFHETVQELIDLIYPESRYVLAEAGDPVVLTAYNRISIIRSQIASHAATVIQNHLRETFRLQDKHVAPNYRGAHSWLLWARQLASGPLFFEVPTPLECRVPSDDPAFIFPHGRMRSPFLLGVVTNALSHADGSIKDRSLFPFGLFSISMAALERAACSIKEDATIDSKLMTTFCKVKWGEAIRNYCNLCCAFDPDTLASILNLCQNIDDAGCVIPAEGQDDVRIVQRANIFSFPSPTK
ncbi:hypothetical protein H1R20_g7477, partial [Candolleomyces eurysporus]